MELLCENKSQYSSTFTGFHEKVGSMLNIYFRDQLTRAREEITVYPDNTIGEYVPAAMAGFMLRFPPDWYEISLGGRRIDARQKVRNIPLRAKQTIDLVLKPTIRTPLEKAVTILSGATGGKLVFFLGNGISADAFGGKLSTDMIHYDYLRTLASEQPRTFEEKLGHVQELLTAMKDREGQHNMLSFMKLFGSVADLRTGFVAHVIRTCCLADPNEGHIALLDFLEMLRSTNPKLDIIVFTTNYDNLLEKTARKLKAWTLKPEYVTEVSKVRGGRLQVIPLHGSIRISRCPGCGSVLQTQAAALGERLCVYCGTNIPNIILPTAEGDISKRALQAFESHIRDAKVLFSVGYGFKDPHIKDSIIRNKSDEILMICASRSVSDVTSKELGVDALLAEDIPLSLKYLAARLDIGRYLDFQLQKEMESEGFPFRRFYRTQRLLGKQLRIISPLLFGGMTRPLKRTSGRRR